LEQVLGKNPGYCSANSCRHTAYPLIFLSHNLCAASFLRAFQWLKHREKVVMLHKTSNLLCALRQKKAHIYPEKLLPHGSSSLPQLTGPLLEDSERYALQESFRISII
jgi:hypothetical protein